MSNGQQQHAAEMQLMLNIHILSDADGLWPAEGKD